VLGKDGLPIMPFASQADWEAFLEVEHATSPGVRIKLAKKASGIPTVSYALALEVALCFGWIDGQTGSLDETWYLQRFTPRRRKSKWSQINVRHVARLIAEGRMRPAGLAQIEAAKADGRWDAAYESPANATVPDDLAVALAANPAADAFFRTLTGSNRYGVLYRIRDAKWPETRARRIANFVQMLAEGRTIQ